MHLAMHELGLSFAIFLIDNGEAAGEIYLLRCIWTDVIIDNAVVAVDLGNKLRRRRKFLFLAEEEKTTTPLNIYSSLWLSPNVTSEKDPFYCVKKAPGELKWIKTAMK